MSRLRFALIISWLVGCGAAQGSGTRTGNGTDQSGTDDDLVTVGGARGPKAPCQRPSEASVRPDRRRALEAFVGGRHREAVSAFELSSREHPEDLTVQALLVASRARQIAAAERGAQALDTLPRMRVIPPREGYKLVKPIDGLGPTRPVKLSRVSETPNQITDDDTWLTKHRISQEERSVSRVRPEDLPDAAPRMVLRSPAQRMFSYPDHTIVSYGPTLAVLWPPNSAQLFDVSTFPEITGARVVGKTLLLSTWRNGYAKDVAGKTGYIAAYASADGSLLWQSEPLVTSMGGFIVTAQHVISSYGFTAEPDFIYLLDLATGKTLQKEALRSGPSMIVRRGDRVLLRNYDTDAEFGLAPAPGEAPPSGLPQRSDDREAAADDVHRLCHIERAVVAADQRNEADLKQAIEGLRAERAAREVLGAFDGVLSFIQQQKSGTPGIDLWARAPQKLLAPPWQRESRRPVGAPVTTRPSFKPLASNAASPIRNMDPPSGPTFVPGKPLFLAPVLKGKLPPGARADIPSAYGLEDLRVVIPDQDDRLLLIYGGRYLAVIKGSMTEAFFDLESYRHPPQVDPLNAEFAVADVTYALVRGSTVFIANGGGSYAKEMGGKKGFVTAIDLRSGELLWRSEPLVHGAGPFVFWRGFLITGYGFTAEPDFTYMLRRDTGEVAAKASIKSAPDAFVLQGDRLRIETYDHTHELELSER